MKFAAYLRKSDPRQKETSLDDQLRVIGEWVTQNGHEIVAVFEDSGLTGQTAAPRQGLQAMMEEIESPFRRFEGIAVHQLSRLSRDVGDSWRIIFRRLKFHKIRLMAVADGIDTVDRNAKIQVLFKSMQNEIFLDDQRANVKRGMDGAFSRGFSTGSIAFGYITKPVYEDEADPDPRAVEGFEILIDQNKADIVRDIYRRYLEGEGYRTIARSINESTGLKMTGTRIRGILNNTTYFGRFLYNKHEHAKHPETEKTTFLPRHKSEWLHRYDPSLAIIDKKTWKTVHRIMKQREGMFKDRPATSKHLLTGLLFCERCGGRISIVQHSYYGCSTAHHNSKLCKERFLIERESLEQVVIASIAKHLHAHLETLVESVRLRIDASTQNSTTTQEQVAHLEEQADRLLGFIQSTKLTGRAKQKVETQFQQLNDQIEQLQRKKVESVVIPMSVRYDRNVLKAFIAELPQALACDRSAGAELLRHIVKTVRIQPGQARPRTCPLCNKTLEKFGPPHARLHNMEFSDFLRKFPWIGSTNDMSLQMTFNAKGLFKKEKIVGLHVLGIQTFPPDDFPPFEITVLQPTIAA